MLHGDDHVSQGHQPGAGVGVLLIGQLAGRQVEFRKAQHVGGAIHLPHVPIDLMDPRVVGQEHIDLTGEGHALGCQRRADDPADKGPLFIADPRHIGGNGDIMPLRHYFFLLSSYRA